MAERDLSILRVSPRDEGGGAEVTIQALHRALRARGIEDQWWVGTATAPSGLASPLPPVGPWRAMLRRVEAFLHRAVLLQPRTGFPLERLGELTAAAPDLLHVHNLLDGPLDLWDFASFSHTLPVVLSVHDMRLLGCGCLAPEFCSERDRGCRRCPTFSHLAALRRWGPRWTHGIRQALFHAADLDVVLPSRFALHALRQSHLAGPGIRFHCIPHAVDGDVFHPAPHAPESHALGSHVPGSHVHPRAAGDGTETVRLLFAATSPRRNAAKDWPTVRQAALLAARSLPERAFRLTVVGAPGPEERLGNLQIAWVPWIADPGAMAVRYRCADMLLHAAHSEIWGRVVTESMACATPVIATDVGGIGDQIDSGRTGFLTPPGDAHAMADRIVDLVRQPGLLAAMGEAAADHVRARYTLPRQAEAYHALYREILVRHAARPRDDEAASPKASPKG